MTTPSNSSFGRRLVLRLGLLLALLAGPLAAQSTVKKTYDLPADVAANSLRRFADQSGLEVVFGTDTTAKVRTNAVRGAYTAREAVDLLLARTGLVAEQNAASGAFTILTGPNVPRAEATESVRPGRATGEGNDKPLELPTFEVMGSKLLNMDIRRSRDDAQPYVVFERETISNSGATNLEDFFKTRLTMNSVAGVNAQSPTTIGPISQINLRGLGTDQTLILIDGRRTASVQGSSTIPRQPDLNGIPLSAIERVEILPTTASGIYGGSATGGVINIVLRRDYAGVELKVSYRNSSSSDVATIGGDLTFGMNLENGKTNMLFAASWAESNGLSVRDRDFLRNGRARILANNPGFYSAATNPPLGATPNIRSVNGSSLFGPGTSHITSIPLGYAGGGGLVPLQANAGSYNIAPAPTAQLSGGSLRDLLNQPRVTSQNLTVRRQFTADLQAFVELAYARNQGRQYTAGLPSSYTISATAPNNPFRQAVRVTIPTNQGDGFLEVQHDSLRAVTGVLFKLPAEWQGALDYTWQRTTVEREGSSSTNGSEVAVIATGGLDILRDTIRFPLDLSPYIATLGLPKRPVDMHSGSLRISGPVGRLLGGVPTVSILAEHRQEIFGKGKQTSNFPGFALDLLEREQSISSGYFETKLPIIATSLHRRFLNQAELQLAARWDQYRVTGSRSSIPTGSNTPVVRLTNRNDSLNPTVAARVQIVPDLILRGSYGTGFLPPNINQLTPNTPITLNATTTLDPRRGLTPMGTITTTTGGNPGLKPEESVSWSAGAVVTPRQVKGLRVSLDWVRIKKTDNIATILQLPIVLANEAALPGRITRGANLPGDPADWAGPVTAADLTAANLAATELEAWDVALDHGWRTQNIGAFNLFAAATWTTHFLTRVAPSAALLENVGIASSTTSNPLKFKTNAGLTWTMNGWTLGWSAQRFHKYQVAADPTTTGAATVANQGGRFVPAQTYHDVFVAYRWGSDFGRDRWSALLTNSELRIAVRNVFNSEPPFDAAGDQGLLYSPYGDPRLAVYEVSFKKTF